MDSSDLSIVLAFAAGLLSFVSPCVLPLVPAYIAYLSGRTALDQSAGRLLTFSHALAFVMGFTAVFTIIFGLAAGLLSQALSDYLTWLRQIGGAVVIVLGLHLLGAIRVPFLDYDRRIGQSSAQRQQGYATSFIVGLSFAAGWTPCVGPMLGAIFSLALNEGEAGRAVLLFLVYSLGLGAPFLVTALALDVLAKRLRSLQRHMQMIERVSGILLVAIGVLLLTDGLARLARLIQWTPPV